MLLCECLDVVFLSGNRFSTFLFNITLTTNSTIRGLYLSQNNLSASLSPAICDMVELEALFLDDNAFTGSIPACMGRLRGLQQLYMFNNRLSGQVPAELGTLRRLSKYYIV
jgi:Leucine-rich repeat (LRR) protein